MSARGLFVTGTDTDVGKTWVSVQLIRDLRSRGIDAVGMKPIECGSYDDSQALLEVSDTPGLTLKGVNPIHLPEPLAPAAASEPVRIDFEDLRRRYQKLADQHEFVVVEGAGGWLVPVDDTRTVADLAEFFHLPVLVVAANRLGVLNHSLLTVNAIASTPLTCCGIFLNQLDPEGDLSTRSNAALLKRNLKNVPVIEQDLDRLIEICLDS